MNNFFKIISKFSTLLSNIVIVFVCLGAIQYAFSATKNQNNGLELLIGKRLISLSDDNIDVRISEGTIQKFKISPEVHDNTCSIELGDVVEHISISENNKNEFILNTVNVKDIDFSLVINKICDDEKYTHTINFKTIPIPEYKVFGREKKPSRNDYQKIFVRKNKKTKKAIIDIYGSEVVLDLTHPILEGFNIVCNRNNYECNENIESLNIEADKLVIPNRIDIPDSSLSITARKVTFEDVNDDTALINITPLKHREPMNLLADDGKTLRENANNGKNGRPLKIYAKSIEQTKASKRFIAEGAEGQDAGEGVTGNVGRDALGNTAKPPKLLSRNDWCNVVSPPQDIENAQGYTRGKIPRMKALNTKQHKNPCFPPVKFQLGSTIKNELLKHKINLKRDRHLILEPSLCNTKWNDKYRESIIHATGMGYIKPSSDFDRRQFPSLYGYFNWGNTSPPEDGCPGLSAPFPGNGGEGSDVIVSNSLFLDMVLNQGGESGAEGQIANGGLPGRPTKYRTLINKSEPGFKYPVNGPGFGRAPFSLRFDYQQYKKHVLDTRPNPSVKYLDAKKYFTENWEVSEHLAKKGTDTSPRKRNSNPGKKGVTQISNASTWLSPNWVDQSIRYVEGMFRSGHYDQALDQAYKYLKMLDESPLSKEMCKTQLTNTTNTSSNCPWPSNETERLVISQSQLTHIVHNINAGLDYFGRPIGWVPNLSFELTFSTFEENIKRATELLSVLLTLEIENKKGILSYESADKISEQMRKESIVFYNNLKNHRSNLESYLSDALDLDRMFHETGSDIEIRIKDLYKEANDKLSDKYARSFHRQWFEGIGQIFSLMPVPEAQAIGGISIFLSKLGEKTPDYKSLADSISKFTATDKPNLFQKMENSLENIVNPPKKPKLKDGASTKDKKIHQEQLEKYAKDRRAEKVELGKALANLAQSFSEASKINFNNSVPEGELEIEFEKLKKSDSIFLEYEDIFDDLSERRKNIISRFNETQSKIYKITDTLNSNLLLWSDLEFKKTQNLLDSQPLLFLDGVSDRVIDQLAEGYYLVKKAFEYRFLIDANDASISSTEKAEQFLDDTKERLQACILKGKEECINKLPQVILVGYKSSLQEYRNYIYNQMQQKIAGDQLKLRTRTLTISNNSQWKNTLEELNSKKRNTTIYLPNTIIVGPEDWNIRVKKINVSRMVLEEEIEKEAELEINIGYGEESYFKTEQSMIRFSHSPSSPWGATVHLPANCGNSTKCGSINNFSENELVSSLAKMLGGDKVEQARTFIWPSAQGEIQLSRSLSSDAEINKLNIKEIQLQFELEVQTVEEPFATLTLRNNSNLRLKLSKPDFFGRDDGVGQFERIYPFGSKVIISAPSSINGRDFLRWSNGKTTKSIHYVSDEASLSCLAPIYEGDTNLCSM